MVRPSPLKSKQITNYEIASNLKSIDTLELTRLHHQQVLYTVVVAVEPGATNTTEWKPP